MAPFAWLFLLFLPCIYSSRQADRYFFKGSKVHKAFIPANPWQTNSDSPHPTYFVRKWPFENSRFRISFNPIRCNSGKPTKHMILIFLIDENLPGEELKAETNNSFMIGGSRFHPHVAGELLSRSFTYVMGRFMNGSQYPLGGFDQLNLNMGNSHFYMQIKKPYMTMYLFKENSKELIFRSTISSQVDARYFTMFATHWRACPVHISAFDDDFEDWVPGKEMKILRGPKKTKIQYESCFASTLFALTFIGLFLLIVLKFVMPGIMNAFFPLLDEAKENEQKRRDMGFGSFDLADTGLSITAPPEDSNYSAEKALTTAGAGRKPKPSADSLLKLLRLNKSFRKKKELEKNSQLTARSNKSKKAAAKSIRSKKIQSSRSKKAKSMKLVTPGAPSAKAITHKTTKIPLEQPDVKIEAKPIGKQSMMISVTGGSQEVFRPQEDLTQKSMR